MVEPKPPRFNSEFEVAIQDEGQRRVVIVWRDQAGARWEVMYYGHSAEVVAREIRHHTALGELEQQSYLRGLSRGIALERRRG